MALYKKPTCIPCIKISNINDWYYIKNALESIGYRYENCNINDTIIDNCLLVLNCGGVFGILSFGESITDGPVLWELPEKIHISKKEIAEKFGCEIDQIIIDD